MPITLSTLIPGFEAWWTKQSVPVRVLVSCTWLLTLMIYGVGFIWMSFGLLAAGTGIDVPGLIPAVVFYGITMFSLLVYLVHLDAKD